MDERHFVIDLGDGKTLDFVGANAVKYRSIVSGFEGIMMCVLEKGGLDASIMCPMLIFKNKSSRYPTQVLPDSLKGVCYRPSPSAFINGRLMTEWLEKPQCWGPGGPFASSRTLWMDNASGHGGDDVGNTARLFRTTVNLSFLTLPTRLNQQIASPFSESRSQLCARHNMEAIRNGDWKQGAFSSGKLANPDKAFYLSWQQSASNL